MKNKVKHIKRKNIRKQSQTHKEDEILENKVIVYKRNTHWKIKTKQIEWEKHLTIKPYTLRGKHWEIQTNTQIGINI